MTVWQRVKLQEGTAGISVAGESAAILPSFRYPKMASEAPGGGERGKPKFVAGPDPPPAALPGQGRGHLPPLEGLQGGGVPASPGGGASLHQPAGARVHLQVNGPLARRGRLINFS